MLLLRGLSNSRKEEVMTLMEIFLWGNQEDSQEAYESIVTLLEGAR